MSSEFLCQDLEAKLFNWFASRLNASIIKRSGEMNVQIGDRVKVVDQDITGVVVEMGWGNKVVITDDASEYEAPDNRLEFRDYELEVTK